MYGYSVGLDEVSAALNSARDANGPARIIVVPWRTTERTNANLDGTPEHRQVLTPPAGPSGPFA
jgi:hypothetical protein